MSDGVRGPATEAIERLADAQEEQNELLERRNELLEDQNAILAVLAMNFERQHRENWEMEFGERKSYSWTRFGTDVQDALLTLEEESDR